MSALAALGNESIGHARLSPSGAKRWMSCPGSITLEAQVQNTATSYSDEGTACHDIAARCLETGVRPSEMIGTPVVVSHEGEDKRVVVFTEDMAELTTTYVTAIEATSMTQDIVFDDVEQKVEFSEWVGVPGQFGTADYIALVKTPEGYELRVEDAKFGRVPVSPVNNPQLMLYALGVLSSISAKAAKRGVTEDQITSVRLCIHQPKLYAEAQEWVCTVKDIKEFAQLARSKAVSAENAAKLIATMPQGDWAELFLNPTPNDEDCRFCRAMPNCPKARAKVESVTQAFGAIPDICQGGVEAMLPVEGDALNTAMLAVPFIETFCTSVRAEVERRLMRGESVTDFGLELGRQGARKFANVEEAEDLIRKGLRLSIEQSCDLKLKSPTQLEKLTVAKPGDKPVIGPRQWAKVEALVVREPPKPSVKPKAQIKVPYIVSPLETFGVVPEQPSE